MNPIVEGQIRQLKQGLSDVQETLTAAAAQLAESETNHQQLLTKFWNQSHELQVLKESMPEFEALREYAKSLERVMDELQQRLNRLLDCLKALTQEVLK